ncbi:hypothetical protein [Pseudovibrio sp. Tun.PSC04-5.I4]|uniref:hypothetical protein n=1 Tax=Pseudovibrio sp. Tun.PSC04-5.I4 TaxID=1798213 RepID=UPI000887603B|nr:hypothetical protein [Pseudovibrio sp. Tun.PSC04-5.I4]SDR15046.1 hypothetical protein SAMN04515695_3031 [Pseudovibrio sp. Tun.PSC04-5.I4]
MITAAGTTLNRDYLPPSFFQANGSLAVSEERAISFQTSVEARLATLPPEHHGTFLSFVSLPQFSGSADYDQSTTDEVLNRLEAATKAIGSLDSIDSTSSLSRLIAQALYKSAVNQRLNELDTRLLAREVVKTSMHAQAGKSRDAADETRTGAIVSIVIAVVTSVVAIIMSAVAIGSASKGLGAAKNSASNNAQAAKLETQANSLTGSNQAAAKVRIADQAANLRQTAKGFDAVAGASGSRAQSIATIGGVVNTLGSTGSQSASAFTQANAKEDEAISQELAAGAEEVRKENDQAESVQKALDDIIRAIIQFLKESREIENERAAAITRS